MRMKRNPFAVSPTPSKNGRCTYAATVAQAIESRRALLDRALAQLAERPGVLALIAAWLVDTLRRGNKVLIAGNGGSAAEAQHFAAELVGRFKRERAPYPVLAITTDTAILTAVSNDYGYDHVFARQVTALAGPGDLLMLFSTSGESRNVLAAAEAGRNRGAAVIAFTGQRRSRLERFADLTARLPASDTTLIQELHTIVTHILCELVESELEASRGGE